MQEHAELGVAAHWRYKEGGARDALYERKIEWVRRMLDPAGGAVADGDFIDRVRQELFADRVYALTPRGEVVDLPRGATPLDFAYHVHTQLGHSCRGAQGQRAHRAARSAARQWRDRRDHQRTQRRSEPRLAQAPRAGSWPRPGAAPRCAPGSTSATRPRRRRAGHRHRGGCGNCARCTGPDTIPRRKKHVRTRRTTAVDIEGVGDMPTTMARCCAPVPPEPIAGYLTLGRGVTVHLAACKSLQRMRALHPKRVLQVEWNLGTEELMPVQIRVEAFDRRGLAARCLRRHGAGAPEHRGSHSTRDPADRVATITHAHRGARHDATAPGAQAPRQRGQRAARWRVG